jgi:hypothetical protein
MRRRRVAIAAELGDLSAVEALAKEGGPGEQATGATALVMARARASTRFADLLADGLAARGRGAMSEARALLDRAFVAAEREAEGRFQVRLVAVAPQYLSYGSVAGGRYFSTVDFLFELATGRTLYVPGILTMSPDERRVLRASADPVAATTPAVKSHECIASLIDLDTERVLFEELAVNGDDDCRYHPSISMSYDENLTTLAIPLLRDTTRMWLFELPDNLAPLEGTNLVDLSTVGLRADVAGLAYMSPDGSRILWITRDESGDTLHIRERGRTEFALREAGAQIRLLTKERTDAHFAIAWSDDVVKIYENDRTVATYADAPAKVLGFDEDGRRVAWVDADHLRVRFANGKHVDMPRARIGCSNVDDISFGATAIFTIEDDGDIFCSAVYDLTTRKSHARVTGTPGDDDKRDAEKRALDDAILKKMGVGVTLPLQRGGDQALVKKDGALLIVDATTGKEAARLEGEDDCDVAGARWGKDAIACGSSPGRVRVWSTKSGKKLFESPLPAPPPPMSLERAEESLRCAVGVTLYPLALCESDARAAGLIRP